MSQLHNQLQELANTFDKGIVDDLINIFYQQMNEAKFDFKKFEKTKDYESTSRLAHKIKSSAMNVGAYEIGKILLDIEKNRLSISKKGCGKRN